MTGRRNRAHAPRGSSPRAPLLPWLYYGSKNGIEKIFGLSEQPQSSVRTSLVAVLFVCGKSGLAWDAGLPGRRKRVVENTAASRRPLQGCIKFSSKLFKKLSGYLPNPKNIFFESFRPAFYKRPESFCKAFFKKLLFVCKINYFLKVLF